MEKLLEDLLERMKLRKSEIIVQLKENPVNADNTLSLVLSGEAMAYDSFINELNRLMDYARHRNS